MTLIRLKQKGQMTLPVELRRALSLEEGDLLEANVEDGRVVLSPKALVDRDRQAAVERFLSRSKEVSQRIEAELEREGKTWDDLEEMIVEEARAVRKERASRKEQT